MAKVSALKESVLFKDFSDNEIASLANFVDEKNLNAATPLFLENMKGESMYVVISGGIRLSKMLSEGEEKTLTTMGAGDFFGEMALIEDGPRSVSAIAVQDSHVLVIKRSQFEKLMEESPKVAVKIVIGIYRTLSDRVRSLSPQIQQMILGKAG